MTRNQMQKITELTEQGYKTCPVPLVDHFGRPWDDLDFADVPIGGPVIMRSPDDVFYMVYPSGEVQEELDPEERKKERRGIFFAAHPRRFWLYEQELVETPLGTWRQKSTETRRLPKTPKTNYIEKLQALLPEILEDIIGVTDRGAPEWDSLVINKRRPHTYRAFRQFGEDRVCLHRFEPCTEEEAFAHPHPWPAAFLVLDGEYKQLIGYSDNLEEKPAVLTLDMIARPNFIYSIADRHLWHAVIPQRTTYTIMLNGPPWEDAHKAAPTTKGKDLYKMSREEMIEHMNSCRYFIKDYLEAWG